MCHCHFHPLFSFQGTTETPGPGQTPLRQGYGGLLFAAVAAHNKNREAISRPLWSLPDYQGPTEQSNYTTLFPAVKPVGQVFSHLPRPSARVGGFTYCTRSADRVNRAARVPAACRFPLLTPFTTYLPSRPCASISTKLSIRSLVRASSGTGLSPSSVRMGSRSRRRTIISSTWW